MSEEKTQHARRAVLEVSIDGHDVVGAVAPCLLEFTYTDNSHGKADEVQLTLHNREGKWTREWKPKKGQRVTAAIKCLSWEEPGKDLSLPCGTFKVDEIEFSGPPDKVTIKAVSSDLTGELRETDKTRAWENASLQTVAGQIAGEHGLQLMYDGKPHTFKRQDQRNESDLAFLNRVATERGMNCKVHDGKLILFDAQAAEAAAAAVTIRKTGEMYSPTSWSFKESSSGTDYSDAEWDYTDPDTGTTHSAKVSAGGAGASKTLTGQQRAESPAEALDLAAADLHKANAEAQTASVECMGCPRFAAGATVDLADFDDFSGRYYIKSAKHKVSGSGGYSTSLDLTTGAPTSGGDDEAEDFV